jgi:hypothetical protein
MAAEMQDNQEHAQGRKRGPDNPIPNVYQGEARKLSGQGDSLPEYVGVNLR